jgi:hypothetical protein
MILPIIDDSDLSLRGQIIDPSLESIIDGFLIGSL